MPFPALLPLVGKIGVAAGTHLAGKKIADKLDPDNEMQQQQAQQGQLTPMQVQPLSPQAQSPQALGFDADGSSMKVRIGSILAGAAYGAAQGYKDAEPGDNKLFEAAKKGLVGGFVGNSAVSVNDAIERDGKDAFSTISNGAIAGAGLRYINDKDASFGDALKSGIEGAGHTSAADLSHDFLTKRGGVIGVHLGDMAKGVALGTGLDRVADGEYDNFWRNAGIGAAVSEGASVAGNIFANKFGNGEGDLAQRIAQQSNGMRAVPSVTDQIRDVAQNSDTQVSMDSPSYG